MRIGRRAWFFFAAAAVCFLLYPANFPEFRWVNLAAGGLAAFWGILLSIEALVTRGPGEQGAGLE